ncbi:hypothetical protein KSZ_04830 [Dictyobacter formicarum]|uniref:Uncharacterized protein n=1 Tax=Dictyobacter formicarum TaxID=2778368 RepID=A0ABQ3V9A9_9CHLR|nr:hypothetical protein KSZ_04830 [Dictyobacter formicarum]
MRGWDWRGLSGKSGAIHALVREVARVNDWPEPSYGQVYRIIRGLPEDVKTLAREGRARVSRDV